MTRSRPASSRLADGLATAALLLVLAAALPLVAACAVADGLIRGVGVVAGRACRGLRR